LLAEAGETYLPLLTETFERLAAGTGEIFGHRNGDRLSVRATMAFSVFWLAPRLTRFRAKHPGIELRITSSIWPAEFPDPGIDLEIRHGNGDWPGLDAERLTRDRVFPVCSPALVDRGPGLSHPADLASHTLLHTIGFREGWEQWLVAAGAADLVDAHQGPEFDTAVMTITLAVQGAGIALGRTCFVEEHLAKGALIAPFATSLDTSEAFYLVTPAHHAETEPARAFRDWLRAEVRPYPQA
jgi:LysR family glycine cleavage system transcriptional activator